ncbi:Proteasome activator BLM10 [Coemansia sp. IMI 203386]|nr:Proteasome activator BLM10 [Coemansia sp. IMI 203386]
MRLDEVNWAKHLPYARGTEAEDFERELVVQLKLCTLSGNQAALSALLTQLERQVNYVNVSLPQRIRICRLLYELVALQSLDLGLFCVCCSTLTRLLRRETRLTIEDLSLDWRKLYDLIRNLAFPRPWQDKLIQNRTKLKNAVELVCSVNRFFPPTAAREVLEELLPQIQFNSMDWQLLIVQLINLFVPTTRAPKGFVLDDKDKPEKWLPTIFSLWSFNLRMSGYDAYFMNLVTCLAMEQKGAFRFTNQQIRFAFASGLHFFNLPVTRGSASLPRSVATSLTDTSHFYQLPQGGSLPLSEERAHTFARFIVYTMYDEEAGGTLELFEQLVQMIEPFYHPSNNGGWSGILSRFLRNLAKELLERVRAEAEPDCEVPENMRLTRRMRRRFVVSTRTLAMLLLFSKGEDSVTMSHSTLKHLAEVEPDLIFGPLLDTLYTAIDSVTETHRMISAMRALAKLASTLSNFALYPEGAQHVAPLLVLTLPGIDVNDPTKAWFALTFICNLCLNGVVLRELAASGDMPMVSSKDSDVASQPEEDNVVDNVPNPDMEYVEWVTRASTAQFESWIDQYLRRVFVLVDNMSSSIDSNDTNSSSFTSSDFGLQMMVAHTTEVVLLQCSERYYPMVTRLITNFATSISSLSAVDGMCRIVYAFASALPEQALSALVPICCERIAEEVSNGVGTQASLSKRTQSHSETTLIWYMSILSTLADCQCGQLLVTYKDAIRSTIELVLDKCLSRHVYTIASSTLYNMVGCLTRVYPERGRSVSADVWADPEFQENHFRYWGQYAQVEQGDFAIKWHIAGQSEIDCALEIMRGVISPLITSLESMLQSKSETATGTTNVDNVRMHRLLVALRYSIRCFGALIPPLSNPIADEELVSTIVEDGDSRNMPPRYLLDRQVEAGYLFSEGTPEYKELADMRRDIGRVTAQALVFMAESNEDDVENIKALVLLAQCYMCNFGIDRTMYSNYRRAWSFGLDSFTLDSKKTAMPRYFATRRVMFVQASRMLHNARFGHALSLENEIASRMAHFCLSQYSEVRDYAVSALDDITALLPVLKYPLIPRFLAELSASESSDPERMTGALRVLDTQSMRRTCLRDWRFFPQLVLALCRAQHEDKPQVKKLVRSTAVAQVVHVAAPHPVEELEPRVQDLVEQLGGQQYDDASLLRLKEKCQEQYLFASTENSQLIDALVDILRDAGTTWRFAAIAGYYLDQLSSVKTPLAPRIVATLADNLTSDLVLFRESAAIYLTQLLSRIKHRSKPSTELYMAERPKSDRDYADLCERAISGNQDAQQAPFLDSPSAGWLAWPHTTHVFPQPSPGTSVAYESIDPEYQGAYDAVRVAIFSAEKWERIARLFSLECTRSPEEDSFGVPRAALQEQLFSLFGVSLLEQAWSSIEKLAMDFERIGAQRAAAEMIAGLVRGSKHWGKDALARMWELLIPLLTLVFSRLRPDTLRFWQVCLQYSIARRDPRRYLPLIELVVCTNAFDPQAEAPFAEASKLELLRVLLSCWDWRIASTIVASRPRLMDALAHPYKQVRDIAGIVMYMLFSSEYSISYQCVSTAIDDFARYGSTGRDFSHWGGTRRTQGLIRDMTANVDAWKEEHIPSNEGTSNYIRGSKTLLTFFLASFGYCSRRLAIEHIPTILPIFSVLQEQHDDEDVSRLANVIMQFFSQVLYTAEISEGVANKILALLDESSAMWHVIHKTLPLLCTLTFSNRFTLSREVRMRIMDTTAAFLEHEQIEVRQSASSSLTSLIKCASHKVMADINSKFSAKLSTRLPRVRYGKPPKNPAAYSKLVLTRHAGVLGLSCLVLAFPYTIPEWMPEVLVLLANCIDDPNPIQSTVQRTFAEFRRTHMDTWHEDRKKFTSNQLEILTDMLVSPCYYA